MVIRMRGQITSEIDASAIEKLTTRSKCDEHYRVTVLAYANDRLMLHSCSLAEVGLGNVEHKGTFMTSPVRHFANVAACVPID